MEIEIVGWDAGNLAKCQKHGVGVYELEALLLTTEAFSPDVRHSMEEQRFVAIGRNAAGRPVFVGFTIRQRDGLVLLRPISARYMHAKEAWRYGQGKAETSPADDHR